jgi:hypothetical protein
MRDVGSLRRTIWVNAEQTRSYFGSSEARRLRVAALCRSRVAAPMDVADSSDDERVVYDVHRHCKVCEWRRKLIFDVCPDPAEESDAPKNTCDSRSPIILKGMHANPGPVWRSIVNTSTLSIVSRPQSRIGSTRSWIRIPLRLPDNDRALAPSDCDFGYGGTMHRYCDRVLGWHNCPLGSLVKPSFGRIGCGILVDRRLRFGENSHNGNIGVYLYSDGGVDTFEYTRGWVSLEIMACNTTRLRGGRVNRYCVNGPTGVACMKAVLNALWVPFDELPSLVFLA